MIYDNVKAICEKQGISIAALEKMAALSNGTIGKWQTANPNINSLVNVAKALKVDINALLDSKEAP
jgi:transcriptional regulator with XRE-family HTH domain